MLTPTDHRRDAAGLTYIYPVWSRRAGGISIGINLNPNNACNWRCVYCQVPDLVRAAAPPIDCALLERELTGLLADVADGSFFQHFEVPADDRVIRDFAISGNGEPTMSPDFGAVVEIIVRVAARFDPDGCFNKVLISNGSRIARPDIRDALAVWREIGGEVWFKIDRGDPEAILRVNGVTLTPENVLDRLAAVAAICPVWVQTCMFGFDGKAPRSSELDAYLALLAEASTRGIPLRGVHLYGLARPSLQAEAARLSRLEPDWMQALAGRIRSLGLAVTVNP